MKHDRIDYWRAKIRSLAETASRLPLAEEVAFRNRLQKWMLHLDDIARRSQSIEGKTWQIKPVENVIEFPVVLCGCGKPAHHIGRCTGFVSPMRGRVFHRGRKAGL